VAAKGVVGSGGVCEDALDTRLELLAVSSLGVSKEMHFSRLKFLLGFDDLNLALPNEIIKKFTATAKIICRPTSVSTPYITHRPKT
jgi:hypothetical protein